MEVQHSARKPTPTPKQTQTANEKTQKGYTESSFVPLIGHTGRWRFYENGICTASRDVRYGASIWRCWLSKVNP
jgi:hypothetical protein